MQVKMINNRPVKIWTDNIEESAMRQIENLTTLPFLFHHLAIMPDVHAGMGMPIGGVLACTDAVIPNAVGVDIGCGMCAVKTNWKVSDTWRVSATPTRSVRALMALAVCCRARQPSKLSTWQQRWHSWKPRASSMLSAVKTICRRHQEPTRTSRKSLPMRLTW